MIIGVATDNENTFVSCTECASVTVTDCEKDPEAPIVPEMIPPGLMPTPAVNPDPEKVYGGAPPDTDTPC